MKSCECKYKLLENGDIDFYWDDARLSVGLLK